MILWQMVNHRGKYYNLHLCKWKMLLPYYCCVADGRPPKMYVTTFINYLMADVIAKVADGMATQVGLSE